MFSQGKFSHRFSNATEIPGIKYNELQERSGGLALLLVHWLRVRLRVSANAPALGPHYGVTTSESSEIVSAELQIWPILLEIAEIFATKYPW